MNNNCNNISQLKKHNPTLRDFLNGSPYDPHFNIDNQLTEELFHECLFVESDGLKKLCEEFKKTIDDIIIPNQLIFVSGYAGNGKTTFVRTFQSRHDEYRHIYYDFQEKRAGFSTSDNDLEVKLMLIRAIRNSFSEDNSPSQTDIKATFYFLYTNRVYLKHEDLISRNCFRELDSETNSGKIDYEFINKLEEIFSLKDIFTTFFVHIFLHANTDKKTIIYFDNLDITAMEYLSNVFLVYFQESLYNANLLARSHLFEDKKIRFQNNFYFVFCLRDANDAIINQHLAPRISLKRFHFSIIFDPEYYKRIVERRIVVLDQVLQPKELTKTGISLQKLKATLLTFIEDSYFTNVFIPLYNYDYRKIVNILLNTIVKHELSTATNKRYGMRGLLVFEVVKSLSTNNFLRDYLDKYPDKSNGYCSIDRVMLTVLINSSDYVRDTTIKGSSNTSDFYSFIKRLTHVYKEVDVVLESIGRCFLNHEKNWVHLLTLINCKIDNLDDFISEYQDKFQKIQEDPDLRENIKLKNSLNNIKLRINASGFAYLRYVLNHFEFYSNLAENSTPLFVFPLEKTARGNRYTFEDVIDNVFHVVRTHTDSMGTFFEDNYIPIGIMPEKYYQSDFCFRHLGGSKHAQSAGYFHSTRVITSHIDYLDNFRRQAIKETYLPEDEKIRINKILIAKVDKYITLLEKSHDKKAAKDFSDLRKGVKKIIASDYRDMHTQIKLPDENR